MDREYTYDWRRSEHARVTALLTRETLGRGMFRVVRFAVWVVVALGLGISLAGLIAGDIELVVPLLPLALVVAGLMAGFGRIVGWLQAWQLARTDPNTGYPITLRFADSGLRISMETVDAELHWSGVPRVRETSDLFLIHYSRKRAYYLPKRAIPSADEIEELGPWIRSRLPEGAEYVEES